jgi:hypothetical protein
MVGLGSAMATIEKVPRREGIVYKAKIRKQGHPTTTRSFKTCSAAERWASKFEAAIDEGNAGLTLKRIEHSPSAIVPGAANSSQKTMRCHPDQVRVQGVLVGQMRSYH